ncbi:carbohydrate ABC transporter permease [uncultured Sphaerochaeta sp.]|uniref:carbohydrate ABC transporter permease n=1 Tax=uncultured Sphaerochaeta sp. TaxID=886478 RepID=UPI002A0A8F47|nr:carbohydrate ABC transporter permease [uncultured Sphaerochaeta sp.]
MNKQTKQPKELRIYLFKTLLTLSAVIACIPFLYMALMSLTQKDTLNLDFDIATFSSLNYIKVIKNFNILVNLRNSIIVTFSACILNGLISSMAAYAFAKKHFPFRDKLFAIYLATLMIPGQVTMIPVFIIMKNLGLMNTYIALILPIINAFGVFLIRQFMVSLPNDLLDAARIDGCGENRIFFTIVIPLVQPVLVSLVIFTFISSWNDFLWPLIIASKPSMKTLTLAIAALEGSYSTNYGLVMAGATFTFFPPFILYMFLQKQFVEGIALSGIKG